MPKASCGSRRGNGPGARLCLVVRRTDSEREWAYDRVTPVGPLDKALDEARAREWTIPGQNR